MQGEAKNRQAGDGVVDQVEITSNRGVRMELNITQQAARLTNVGFIAKIASSAIDKVTENAKEGISNMLGVLGGPGHG